MHPVAGPRLCVLGGAWGSKREAVVTMPSAPSEDRYTLTLTMRGEYRRKLRVAAILAKEMGLIEEDTMQDLMNLFVNLGLQYVKSESLK